MAALSFWSFVTEFTGKKIDKNRELWYNKEQQVVLMKKAFQPFG